MSYFSRIDCTVTSVCKEACDLKQKWLNSDSSNLFMMLKEQQHMKYNFRKMLIDRQCSQLPSMDPQVSVSVS